MFQAIVVARTTYLQFAAGFGNLEALNAIPVILWISVPVLTAIGMYHHIFWPLVVAYKYISGGCGPNFLCIQNQNIRRLLSHPQCGCFGKFRFHAS